VQSLLYPFRIAVEFVAVFIALTVYGAMWHGAQEGNKNGWVIALIWTIGIVALLNGVHLAQEVWSTQAKH
jgi:type IV secretory pathway VirB2 component (pilin)